MAIVSDQQKASVMGIHLPAGENNITEGDRRAIAELYWGNHDSLLTPGNVEVTPVVDQLSFTGRIPRRTLLDLVLAEEERR